MYAEKLFLAHLRNHAVLSAQAKEVKLTQKVHVRDTIDVWDSLKSLKRQVGIGKIQSSVYFKSWVVL